MFKIVAVALFNKKNELLILKKQFHKAQGVASGGCRQVSLSPEKLPSKLQYER